MIIAIRETPCLTSIGPRIGTRKISRSNTARPRLLRRTAAPATTNDKKKNKDFMSLGPAEKARVPLQYSFPTKYVDVVRSFTMTNARTYQWPDLEYAEEFKRYDSVRFAPAYWWGIRPPKGPPGYYKIHVTGRLGKHLPDSGMWKKFRKWADWHELEYEGGDSYYLCPRVTLDLLVKLHASGGKVSDRVGAIATDIPMQLVTLPGKAP